MGTIMQEITNLQGEKLICKLNLSDSKTKSTGQNPAVS